MILYLDTSSLVKLYVEETASADVEGLVVSAEVTGTSLIAYAEARAAFAHRFRENAFSSKDYNRFRSRFESDQKNIPPFIYLNSQFYLLNSSVILTAMLKIWMTTLN